MNGWSYRAFCSSTGGWLPLVCTMNCTVATELVRSLFELAIDDLEKFASQSEIGAAGVTILPFFNGERTPSLPKGKGCIMGLDAVNYTKQNIVRASMESAISTEGAIDFLYMEFFESNS
jgi:xylulokinase